MRRLLLAAALAAGACGQPATTVRLHVAVAAGEQAPPTLSVSVFDPRRALVLRHAVNHAPPGDLLLDGLSDAAVPLRIVVAGVGPQLGAAQVTTAANAETRASVVLSSATVDTDGDGVPDSVDDCPTVPDPDQADALANGVGDACRAAGDLGSDLAVAVDAGADAAADLAASLDLAPSDLARPDAAPSSLCPGTLAFCEGFETGTLDTSTWTSGIYSANIDGGISVGVDPSISYRGQYSLHVHYDHVPSSTYPSAWISEQGVFPHPARHIRAFVYATPKTLSAIEGDLVVVQNPDYYLWGLDVVGGGQIAVSDSIPNGLQAQSATASLTGGKWVCVEWEVDDDTSGVDAGGGTHVWIDGTEVGDLTATGWPAVKAPAWLMIGLQPKTMSDAGPLDVWYDEVAVDPNYIGCTR